MARLKEYYRCPVCQCLYSSEREATRCKNLHPVTKELWADSISGKSTRAFNPDSPPGIYGSIAWALREADLPDERGARKAALAALAKNKERIDQE